MDIGLYFDDDILDESSSVSEPISLIKGAGTNPEALRALVYDRNQKIAFLISEILKQNGFDAVTVAETADEAILAQGFDLYFIDAGAEIERWTSHVKSVRRLVGAADPFCHFFLSGSALTTDNARHIVNSGCDTYFTRPFQVDTIVTTLNRFKDRHRGYVVAPNYIGPDRRTTTRKHVGKALIPAPSPIGLKRSPFFSNEVYQDMQSLALSALRARLIERTCDALIPLLTKIRHETEKTKDTRQSNRIDQDAAQSLEMRRSAVFETIKQMSDSAAQLSHEQIPEKARTSQMPPINEFRDRLNCYVVKKTFPSSSDVIQIRRDAGLISEFFVSKL